MATTLDHISGGRAILGIGAAWHAGEHEAYGLAFGSGAPERLRWLGEALPVIRGMLRGETPSAAGVRYHAKGVRNAPAPVQARLPLLIGGGGEKVTLRLVARYADACNIGGGVETVRRKEALLQEHCRAVGRDHREIERTTIVGAVVIRDSRSEARRVFERLFEANGRARPWTDQPVGTPRRRGECDPPLPRHRAGLRPPPRRVPRPLRRVVDDALRDGGAAPLGRRPLMRGGGQASRPWPRRSSPSPPMARPRGGDRRPGTRHPAHPAPPGGVGLSYTRPGFRAANQARADAQALGGPG
jgi:alkanesulfonate monooxygenase SsuD/methylene tetrahydromethanopterin reductase-like flavin-dependent oxidoreductase (luciferase family)